MIRSTALGARVSEDIEQFLSFFIILGLVSLCLINLSCILYVYTRRYTHVQVYLEF